MVGINQFDPAVGAVKNDLTIGRYDVVMDTGPGYETKRIEGAEAMIDLLKTPLAEPIAKVGADLVVRNMDFAGASDLADRLAVTTPQGMEKVMEGLPKQAQTIVKSLMTQMDQLKQQNQVLAADLKYGLTKTHLQETSRQDIEQMKDRRAERDTATDAGYQGVRYQIEWTYADCGGRDQGRGRTTQHPCRGQASQGRG